MQAHTGCSDQSWLSKEMYKISMRFSLASTARHPIDNHLRAEAFNKSNITKQAESNLNCLNHNNN